MKMINFFSRNKFRAITVVMTGLLTSQFISAQWYLPYWQYRVPVTITNSTGTTLIEHQVQIILDGSFAWANTLPGGADIRITASDARTDIPFWIESWNEGTSANIWVKVPVVEAGATSIYIYYGRVLAQSASNGFNTFEFFDDFEEGTISASRWTAQQGSWNVVSASQQNGITGKVLHGNVFQPDDKGLLSSSFSGTDYILEGFCQPIGPLTNPNMASGFGFRSTDLGHMYTLNLYTEKDNAPIFNNFHVLNWNGGWDAEFIWRVDLGVIDRNTWYKLKVKAHGDNFDIYFQDLLQFTMTDGTHTSGSVGPYVEPGMTLFNDVWVRKYASSDPTAIFGPEETNQNYILNITLGNGSKTELFCNGDVDGSLNISVSGGSGSYTYNWTPVEPNSPNISGLSAGTYSVDVIDDNGLAGSQIFNITQPSPLVAGYAITSPLLCSSEEATVNIIASGGTSGYTGTGSFQQKAGTLSYTVSDARGCTVSVSVTVDAAGSWYNPAWQYRKEVVVPGGSTNLTEFQIKVTLDNTFDFDKSVDDGSDIRFTSGDGVTTIPYWIEAWNKNNEQASVWVKVPSIPASGTTIFMYYGNPAAAEASDGVSTFEFYDDFESVSTQYGYYPFGPATTILGTHQAWEGGESPHTLSVVRAPATGAFNDYLYYGYYGLNGCTGIGMAGSNDLTTWEKFPTEAQQPAEPNNPLFNTIQERWPTVVLDAGTYYMVHTANWCSGSYLVYRTSSNGLTWSGPQVLIQDAFLNANPNLFLDPVSGNFYLYWWKGGNGDRIMCRTAETFSGLLNASDIELISSNIELAAPSVVYLDGTYFLSTEIWPDRIWKTRIYAASSPVGPFYVLPGNPVPVDGCACMFHTLINNRIYEYYCKQDEMGYWSLEMRIVDPSGGRIGYSDRMIEKTKWTPYGGDWSIASAIQQDGTNGNVAIGNSGSNSILMSLFSGSDYIMEGASRQITGRTWGLGFRSTSNQNTYTLDLNEDLDAGNNLDFKDWANNISLTAASAAIGNITPGTWYKMTIKAHGSNFNAYINDIERINATNSNYLEGAVALHVENGSAAQFNDLRVRKYTATDFVVIPTNNEETWAPTHQWTGYQSANWNDPSNWCGGIPAPGADVVINNPLAPNQPLLPLSSSTVLTNLLISDGSSVTIPAGSALTVNGGLGIVNNGSLTIKSNGVSSNGSLIANQAPELALLSMNV